MPKDEIAEIIKKLKTPKITVCRRSIDKKRKKESCTLWFELSDLQLGTKFSTDETVLNEHNWDVWRSKLQVWKFAVIEKIERNSRDYNIDTVIIACLGDMVDGDDIYFGHGNYIDAFVVDQALQGAVDLAGALIEIFLSFPQINFQILEVFGNHGRIGKKEEKPYRNSMDKVFQRFVHAQIQVVKSITNVKYYFNESWIYLINLYGWNHLLMHGDRGINKIKHRKPSFESIERTFVEYSNMLQTNIHFLHCGHFHSDWQISINMTHFLINGSWVGTDILSSQQMVTASPAIQVMHVFTRREGLVKTERIHLDTGVVKKALNPTVVFA